MTQDDTIKLLGECNAGVKMGVAAIEEVMPSVKNETLRSALQQSKLEHEKLGSETQQMLFSLHEGGREPNPVAKSMSWLKTNARLAMEPTDSVAAELILDGCAMGVKSLSKYLNQYQSADEKAKNITHRLVDIENQLGNNMLSYL